MRHIHWLEKIVGALFVYAAMGKAIDLGQFAAQIKYYGVLDNTDYMRYAAVITVIVETLFGIALLAGLRLRGLTLWANFLLLLGFTGLIFCAWMFNDLVDCGCFGKFIQMGPKASIAKNVLMMAALAASWYAYRKEHPPVESAPRYLKTRIGATVLSLLVVALSVAFGANANFFNPPPPEAPKFAQFKFEFEGLPYDLGQGDFIVCMLSSDCEHCQEAVEILNEIALVPEFSQVVGLVLGTEEQLEQFRLLTEPLFPTTCVEPLPFFSLIEKVPPSFYVTRDGVPLRFLEVLDPELEALIHFIVNEEQPSEAQAHE